ncbi:hypothetical protein EDB82DRAFT_482419 [Fusarium venenatum]|uniref:uncharacterized protein n=1 Tax=Fusarium venenatum TaxID=56646 RepID=UPI001D5C4B09|nr:hypothetical protein EDB82DRAFT_482419 [Fusarium venenatum]
MSPVAVTCGPNSGLMPHPLWSFVALLLMWLSIYSVVPMELSVRGKQKMRDRPARLCKIRGFPYWMGIECNTGFYVRASETKWRGI